MNKNSKEISERESKSNKQGKSPQSRHIAGLTVAADGITAAVIDWLLALRGQDAQAIFKRANFQFSCFEFKLKWVFFLMLKLHPNGYFHYHYPPPRTDCIRNESSMNK